MSNEYAQTIYLNEHQLDKIILDSKYYTFDIIGIYLRPDYDNFKYIKFSSGKYKNANLYYSAYNIDYIIVCYKNFEFYLYDFYYYFIHDYQYTSKYFYVSDSKLLDYFSEICYIFYLGNQLIIDEFDEFYLVSFNRRLIESSIIEKLPFLRVVGFMKTSLNEFKSAIESLQTLQNLDYVKIKKLVADELAASKAKNLRS